MGTPSHALNVRLPDDLLRRVERVQQWLSLQMPGATRTDAVRMVLAKGLESLEADVGRLTQEDRAWMRADLSRLGEFEPYDFGDQAPDALGAPVQHLPNGSFVVGVRR